MDVSYQQLSKAALKKAIEKFISQEGANELPAYQKLLRVQWLLESGKAKIVLDPSTKIHTIVKCEP